MSTMDPRSPDSPDPGDRRDDIDAEFARLTEGLGFDDAELTVDDVLADGPAPGEQAADDDAEEVPTIAVVATSVATDKALAGAVRLGREARTDGIDIPAGVRVHGTETGAIAVGELAEDAAHDLAAITSTALQRNGLVLFWRRGDRMTATRYRGGDRGEDVSPALVLGAVDDLVEELLLGARTPADLDAGLDPTLLSRSDALSWIASGKKKRR